MGRPYLQYLLPAFLWKFQLFRNNWLLCQGIEQSGLDQHTHCIQNAHVYDFYTCTNELSLRLIANEWQHAFYTRITPWSIGSVFDAVFGCKNTNFRLYVLSFSAMLFLLEPFSRSWNARYFSLIVKTILWFDEAVVAKTNRSVNIVYNVHNKYIQTFAFK